MELTEAFIDYIKKENTDYAILIDGVWGSGKTHFVKTQLVPKIEQIPFPGKDKDKKYKVAYITLNGITSTAELERRIFYEMNPWAAKKGWGIFGIAVSKAAGFFNVNTSEKDVIDIFSGIPRSRVFIFDDLERLATDTPEEILGFINSYTEHHKLKVLILADEAEIDIKPEKFKKIKEKLIRFTHKYNAELPKAFIDIVASYQKNQAYFQYLENKKDYVCGVFNRVSHHNLRTLRFVLDLFEGVFNKVLGMQDLSANQRNKILDRYLFFLASYSIKYKTGANEKDLQSLENLSSDLLNPQIGRNNWIDQLLEEQNPEQQPQPREKSFTDLFEEQFIDEQGESNFEYFPFLASYVHSGALDADELQNITLQLKNKLTTRQTNPEQQDLDKLRNALLLDDNQFVPLVERINRYVRQGLYQLEAYPIIFENYCLAAENNLQGITIDAVLAQMFKDGMDLALAHSEYKQGFNARARVMLRDSGFYNDIISYASKKNKSLLHKDDARLASDAWEDIRTRNFTGLEEKIKTSNETESPIFKLAYISADDFFQEFLDMNNSEKNNMVELLVHNIDRYINHGQALTEELPFFHSLQELIDRELARIGGDVRLSTIHIHKFRYWCKQVIERIPPAPEDEEE